MNSGTAAGGQTQSKVNSKNSVVAGGNASKHNSMPATDDKQKSIVFTSSGDNETTLDQLMGQFHLNGLRKRNWDRKNSRPPPVNDRNDAIANATSAVTYPCSNSYWSRGIGDLNVPWTWSSGEDSSSTAYRLVAEPSSSSTKTKPPPKGDAKDITYWTDLFFNNNAQTDNSNGIGQLNGGGANTSLKDKRKTSAASIVIENILKSNDNKKLPHTDLAIGGHSDGSSATSTYLYSDAGSTDYSYLSTGIKRKNNLSKTKISTNLNGESERLNKANELFGLTASSGSNGISDTSNEDSRFIQVRILFDFYFCVHGHAKFFISC